MVKRPPSDSGTSSEYELKPDISDDDIPYIEEKKKVSPTKKPKQSTPREAPRKWTVEEDKIFLEIVGKVVKAGMWDAVKEDGRLGYRGGQGIQAHLTAVMNKLKKPA